MTNKTTILILICILGSVLLSGCIQTREFNTVNIENHENEIDNITKPIVASFKVWSDEIYLLQIVLYPDETVKIINDSVISDNITWSKCGDFTYKIRGFDGITYLRLYDDQVAEVPMKKGTLSGRWSEYK